MPERGKSGNFLDKALTLRGARAGLLVSLVQM
jgi:hypothetical protein